MQILLLDICYEQKGPQESKYGHRNNALAPSGHGNNVQDTYNHTHNLLGKHTSGNDSLCTYGAEHMS